MKNKTIRELVVIYNELTGKSIKKFRDHATAIARVEAELAIKGIGTPVAHKATPKKPVVNKASPRRENKEEKKPSTRSRKVFSFEPFSIIKYHRPNTARDRAVKILARAKGATFEEVQAVTGWDLHRHAYEGIRLLNTHLGYGIREKDGRIQIYAK